MSAWVELVLCRSRIGSTARHRALRCRLVHRGGEYRCVIEDATLHRARFDRGARMKATLMHRRDPSLIRRVAVVVSSTLVLVAAAAATSTTSATAAGTTTTAVAPARENISFFYQQITNTTDLSPLGAVKLVLSGQQDDDTLAANRINEHGGQGYRYVPS